MTVIARLDGIFLQGRKIGVLIFASSLPWLLPSVPSARLQFSCVLQPKWFFFSG